MKIRSKALTISYVLGKLKLALLVVVPLIIVLQWIFLEDKTNKSLGRRNPQNMLDEIDRQVHYHYNNNRTQKVSKPKNQNLTHKTVVISSQNQDEFIRKRFDERRSLVAKFCAKKVKKPEDILNAIPTNEWIVEVALGRLRWCKIPKAGTTFIQYRLTDEINKWSVSKINTDVQKWEEGVNTSVGLTNTKTGMINEAKKFSEEDDVKDKYLFLFVREPYSRLVSCYLDKVLTTPSWWKKLGRRITLSVRSDDSKALKYACGHDVTFLEFIKYFLMSERTGKNRNVHFVPLHDHCDICNSNVTFIGHLETFASDIDYILRQADIHLPVIPSVKEQFMMNKAISCLEKDKPIVESCSDIHQMMSTLWWCFQAWGYISDSIPFPFRPNEGRKVSARVFGDMVIQAHRNSTSFMDSKSQKRKFLVSLYSQIPSQLKAEVREVLMEDFELHGYDPNPSDIFTDLV